MTRSLNQNIRYRLNLQLGDLVEVRSKEEILATLDENCRLEAMPFMPEMLQFCGRRFRVYRRADKTCDTINYSGGLRLRNSVHLEGLRCSGTAHGDCQALCLLFWKEAWLKPVSRNNGIGNIRRTLLLFTNPGTAPDDRRGGASEQILIDATISGIDGDAETGDVHYSCQATELLKATRALQWWDPRQYLRDLLSGNVSLAKTVRTAAFRGYRKLINFGIGYRALIWIYNRFQTLREGTGYPYKQGVCADNTPVESLHLSAGDLVEVKSHDEILETLDKGNRNRGLLFDVEMVRYCGKRYKVLCRVEKIINEKSGKMMNMKTPCIILDGVVCCAEFSEKRLFCPRSIYSYWREAWLRRSEESAPVSLPD